MHIPWESFLARYRPLARNVAAGILGARGDVDDVVQEAAVALWRAVEADTERIRSAEHARNFYLRTVKNLALKARERGVPMRSIESSPAADLGPIPGHAGFDDADPRRDGLASAIGALDPDEREFLRKRFVDRDTLAAISVSTGIPLSTLHSREHALLEKLRRAIERGEREEGRP